MKLRDLLLQGVSFNEILKQFSISQSDFMVKDEEVILSKKNLFDHEILKERLFIQGKSDQGLVSNFFGTLHYNLINSLSVFELDFVEPAKTADVN
ncbi:MAG: hypothetical protein ACOH2A_07195 [Sphingobacteriaceae bacterium]